MASDLLHELENLADDIRDVDVQATHFAAVWIGTGLAVAVQMIEKRRIDLLCEGICDER